MKKLMRKKKGFTLVELLVVVAIIAILMLIALPKFMDATGGARVRVFEANARTLISEANTALASAAGDASKVTVDSLPSLKSTTAGGTTTVTSKLDGKPAGANYTYSGTTLTCTLKDVKIESSSSSTTTTTTTTPSYVITYDLSTGKINQTPGVIGAADFKTN